MTEKGKNILPDRTVDEWVSYIQTLHVREIDLSLERVREVYRRLRPDGLDYQIVSLAGTNGKGSTAAILASIYRQEGYRVGKFTSPHLVDFSERYNVNGHDIDQASLLSAFKTIELARGDVSITYFEFGALLAIELFALLKVDVAVMEVGLGGRLDAINILDADVAAITSISRDHTAWLGDSLESIAYEKSGIARSARPCVVGLLEPYQSIITHCDEIGAKLIHLGRDFSYDFSSGDNQAQPETWSWHSSEESYEHLPLPFGQSGVQLDNASVALAVVDSLSSVLSVSESAIKQGLKEAAVLARCQVLLNSPMVVLDVSHNESSVERLSEFVETIHGELCHTGDSKVVAVCGMLKDKEVEASLQYLKPIIDTWHVASIHDKRGATAQELKGYLDGEVGGSRVIVYDFVNDAFDAAYSTLDKNDVLVVFGSFFVAGDILRHVRSIGLIE